MLFRRFSFAPFHSAQNGRRAHFALVQALRSAIARHSARRLHELFELHEAPAFAHALSRLPLRTQLDALSMLSFCARSQLWPHLPAHVRRAAQPLSLFAVAGGVSCAC